MADNSALERLTYLCAVASAIVAWSVDQITQQISDTKTIAYDISNTVTHDENSTFVDLTNISATKGIDRLTVDIWLDGDCKLKRALEESTGIGLRGGAPPNRTEKAVVFEFDNFSPGSSYRLTAVSSIKCIGHVMAWASDGDTRIIQSNFETFLAKHRFSIMASITAAFVVVFCSSFIVSLRRPTKQASQKK